MYSTKIIANSHPQSQYMNLAGMIYSLAVNERYSQVGS